MKSERFSSLHWNSRYPKLKRDLAIWYHELTIFVLLFTSKQWSTRTQSTSNMVNMGACFTKTCDFYKFWLDEIVKGRTEMSQVYYKLNEKGLEWHKGKKTTSFYFWVYCPFKCSVKCRLLAQPMAWLQGKTTVNNLFRRALTSFSEGGECL